jgi:hypothetical protein
MIAIIICLAYIACGAGKIQMAGQDYMGIFHNISSGRLGFYIASISGPSFSLKEKQIIKFNDMSIQTHAAAYSVTIQKILRYDKKELVLISYLYKAPAPGTNHTITWKGIDIAITDKYGFRRDFTLKESKNINDNLSFAKVISGALFFTISDNTGVIHTMDLNDEKYEIRQYNHQAGLIQNIWLKNGGDGEYIFTSEKDKNFISGIFKITGQGGAEIMEIYNHNMVVGYDTSTGSFFYYNQSNDLLYQNDLTQYAVKEFIGKEEKIYDVFFLGDGEFIIASTATGPDRFGDLFFGSGHLMHYFYYYHIKKHEQNSNFRIKNIKAFGNHWKLEQLILKN